MTPPVGNDWRQWALALSAYLRTGMSQLSVKPTNASAAEDGLALWDRVAKVPNVSRDGAYVPLGVKVSVPASATAAGNPGEWAAESGYLYICIATDTWERATLSTW